MNIVNILSLSTQQTKWIVTQKATSLKFENKFVLMYFINKFLDYPIIRSLPSIIDNSYFY